MWRSQTKLSSDPFGELKSRLRQLPGWKPFKSSEGGMLQHKEVVFNPREERSKLRPTLGGIPGLGDYAVTLFISPASLKPGEFVTFLEDFLPRVKDLPMDDFAISFYWKAPWEKRKLTAASVKKSREELFLGHVDFVSAGANVSHAGLGFVFPENMPADSIEWIERHQAFTRDMAEFGLAPNPVDPGKVIDGVEHRVSWHGRGLAVPQIVQGIGRILANWSAQPADLWASLEIRNYDLPESGAVMDEYLAALWAVETPWTEARLSFAYSEAIFSRQDWDVGSSVFGRWAPVKLPLGEFFQPSYGKWSVSVEVAEGAYTLLLEDKFHSELLPPAAADLGLEFAYIAPAKGKGKKNRSGA